MTLLASLVDLDILLAAGGAVADRLAALGRLEPRAVAASQLGLLTSPTGLGARLDGAAPGQLYLLTGADAAAALSADAGTGDDGLEPVLADVVATLKMQVGDVRPEDVRALGAGDGPVLDESTVAVGIFAGDRLTAAIVFTGSASGATVPAAAPAATGVRAAGSRRPGPRRRTPDEPAARRDDGRQRGARPHPDDRA